MKDIILDTQILNIKGHDYLKEIFDFPLCYGANLDALHDSLSELQNIRITILNGSCANEMSLKMLQVIVDVSLEFDDIVLTYQFN